MADGADTATTNRADAQLPTLTQVANLAPMNQTDGSAKVKTAANRFVASMKRTVWNRQEANTDEKSDVVVSERIASSSAAMPAAMEVDQNRSEPIH